MSGTPPTEPRDRLRVVVAGELDHGKSTLIAALGRRLRGQPLDAGCLAHDLDHLAEERAGGFTWEATELLIEAGGRQWVFCDVPGHAAWVTNMLSGSSRADAALLVLAADGAAGAGTARHAALLALLGLRQVLGVVTRLDLVADPAAVFARQAAALARVAATADLPLAAVVPVCAPAGGGLASGAGPTFAWHAGPPLLDWLADFTPELSDTRGPACVAIQGEAAAGAWWGRVLRGTVAVGDALRHWPSGKPVRVTAITRWPADPRPAAAGEHVALSLSGVHHPCRGNWLLAPAAPWPADDGRFVTLRVYWLDAEPPAVGGAVVLHAGFQEVTARMTTVAPAAPSGQVLITLNTVAPFWLVPGLAPADGRVLLLRDGALVGLGRPVAEASLAGAGARR